jgi:hypothetical protein
MVRGGPLIILRAFLLLRHDKWGSLRKISSHPQ